MKKKIDISNAFDKALTRLQKIAGKSVRFKVGETGQKIKDRYSKDVTYTAFYDGIEKIYSSKNKLLIDALESALIKHSMRYYKKKCDNISPDSLGDMTEATAQYKIYVVYKSITKKKAKKRTPSKTK